MSEKSTKTQAKTKKPTKCEKTEKTVEKKVNKKVDCATNNTSCDGNIDNEVMTLLDEFFRYMLIITSTRDLISLKASLEAEYNEKENCTCNCKKTCDCNEKYSAEGLIDAIGIDEENGIVNVLWSNGEVTMSEAPTGIPFDLLTVYSLCLIKFLVGEDNCSLFYKPVIDLYKERYLSKEKSSKGEYSKNNITNNFDALERLAIHYLYALPKDLTFSEALSDVERKIMEHKNNSYMKTVLEERYFAEKVKGGLFALKERVEDMTVGEVLTLLQ